MTRSGREMIRRTRVQLMMWLLLLTKSLQTKSLLNREALPSRGNGEAVGLGWEIVLWSVRWSSPALCWH